MGLVGRGFKDTAEGGLQQGSKSGTDSTASHQFRDISSNYSVGPSAQEKNEDAMDSKRRKVDKTVIELDSAGQYEGQGALAAAAEQFGGLSDFLLKEDKLFTY